MLGNGATGAGAVRPGGGPYEEKCDGGMMARAAKWRSQRHGRTAGASIALQSHSD